MANNKTIIVGASKNPSRYAYEAAFALRADGHTIVPMSIKTGMLAGEKILDLRQHPVVEDVHTITLYISKKHQPEWYDYLLGLNPMRIIFNPGAENEEFKALAEKQGIKVEEACTLVMLRIGVY